MIHDTHGYPTSDHVPCHVVERPTSGVRAPDVVVLFSGKKFVAVLSQTLAEKAAEVAERLSCPRRRPLSPVPSVLNG